MQTDQSEIQQPLHATNTGRVKLLFRVGSVDFPEPSHLRAPAREPVEAGAVLGGVRGV